LGRCGRPARGGGGHKAQAALWLGIPPVLRVRPPRSNCDEVRAGATQWWPARHALRPPTSPLLGLHVSRRARSQLSEPTQHGSPLPATAQLTSLHLWQRPTLRTALPRQEAAQLRAQGQEGGLQGSAHEAPAQRPAPPQARQCQCCSALRHLFTHAFGKVLPSVMQTGAHSFVQVLHLQQAGSGRGSDNDTHPCNPVRGRTLPHRLHRPLQGQCSGCAASVLT
jgi:hypothetical protein